MAPQRLFLERRSYRMRRLMDVVRLLPVLGLGLWLLPLMWAHPEEDTTPMTTSEALLYLFAVWVFMVLAGLVLWWRTRDFADRDLMRSDPAQGN